MKTLLLFLSSILISIILIEASARLHGGYKDYLSELNDWNRAIKRQPLLPTTIKAAETENSYKIIAIGDSFTFGQGILDVKKVWPGRLETCLRQDQEIRDLGISIEVVNLGQNGLAFKKENSLVAEYFIKNPGVDMVVHQIFLNDYLVHYVDNIASYKHVGNPGSTPLVGPDLIFHAWFYWKKFNFIHIAKRESFIDWVKQWKGKGLKHWAKHNEDLLSLVTTVHENNAKLVSFLVPTNLWDENNYSFREFHRNIVDSARNMTGHEIIDISQRLFEKFPSGYDHWINSFDSHPNEIIHEAYGNIICEVVKPNITGRSVK
jgi:hypothetical protein